MENCFEKNLKAILDEISNLNFIKYDPSEINLFYMLGIEHNEVLICRLIGALIQPNGIHNLGTEPLKLFLKALDKDIPLTSVDLENAEVMLEEKIDNNRRVDIVIHTQKIVIPIEVKIWAGDQEAQLYDYYHYYKSREDISEKKIDKIFYLTPSGWDPSDKSISSNENTDDDSCLENIQKISFQENVKNFLEALLKEQVSAELKTIIQEFISVIERMNADMINHNELKECIKGIDETQLPALLVALNAKDDLWDEIRFKYLKNSIENYSRNKNRNYKIERYDDKGAFDDVDPHCKYIITKPDDKDFVLYVCIDTNLYLARESKTAEQEDKNKKWEAYEKNSEYSWRYIYYKGSKKKWSLRNIDTDIFSRTIEWEQYLEN